MKEELDRKDITIKDIEQHLANLIITCSINPSDAKFTFLAVRAYKEFIKNLETETGSWVF